MEDELREATRRAVETSAKAIEAAERGLDETMSAFIAWALVTTWTLRMPVRRV